MLCIQAWLRRKPVKFCAGGVGYQLRTLRVGSMEIDLFTGWLRSRGRLPCLAVVLGGLDVLLEVESPRESNAGGGEGETPCNDLYRASCAFSSGVVGVAEIVECVFVPCVAQCHEVRYVMSSILYSAIRSATVYRFDEERPEISCLFRPLTFVARYAMSSGRRRAAHSITNIRGLWPAYVVSQTARCKYSGEHAPLVQRSNEGMSACVNDSQFCFRCNTRKCICQMKE